MGAMDAMCRFMSSFTTTALVCALASTGLGATAQEATPPRVLEGSPAPKAFAATSDPVIDAAGGDGSRIAVVIGMVSTFGPEYAGAARSTLGWEPGFAVRWGRLSFASRSAFAVRSSEPGTGGGLRLELARSDRWRAGLGLRQDGGRDASSSPSLAGMGDIRRTLRARLSASTQVGPGWRVGAAWMVDLLGRGNGQLGDINFGRDFGLTPRTGVNASAALGLGNRRYMQKWYGVTPAQAASSGYAPYKPRVGLREIAVSLGGRTQIDAHWAVFYGIGASRLLGGAADSPLSFEPQSWNARAGLVYRF